jgi:hypothetical protein
VSQRTFHHVDLVGERGETVWYIGGLGAALGLRAAE